MWQDLLKKNLKNTEDLFSFIKIEKKIKNQILSCSSFNLNLPIRLAKKIEKEKPLFDPIFKQFIPTIEEKKITKGFCPDPVQDRVFQSFNLIQKYKNRALLICSDRCALNCRFCFRQNFKYRVKDYTFKNELALLQKKKEVNELILSGGDPLTIENCYLEKLLKNLENIPHVRRIRFHTRMITAFPERIDKELLKILKKCKRQIIFVIHVNHPQELDEEIFQAIFKIQSLNIPFLSQTVLLKEVNDRVDILLNLLETLSNHGIIPYYLHQLDKIQGAAHFEVSIAKGKKLIHSLRELTSGYNIPSYVFEKTYEKSKTLLV